MQHRAPWAIGLRLCPYCAVPFPFDLHAFALASSNGNQRIHTSGDVPRTGREISDSETMLRIAGHVHAGGGLSVGGYLSYSKHTDDNFDNIRKLGVSLRYHF